MNRIDILNLAVVGLCCQFLMPLDAYAQNRPSKAVSAAVPNPAPKSFDKDVALKAKIRIWGWTLTQIAKREGATMFVDVPLDLDPPNITYDKPYGVAAMMALANSSDRVWKETASVQTFTRSAVRKSTAQVTAALEWLGVLPDDEFGRLLGGEVALSDLDPQTRDIMLGLAGWEPDMSFTLLGKLDSTQVQLRMCPKVRFTDPKTGAPKDLRISSYPKRNALKPRNAGIDLTYGPLDKPTSGALKFGTGEILTLLEVVRRAGDVFHITYEVDSRVGENRYFLSGSYNKEVFEEVLSKVSTVPQVRVKQLKPDRAGNLALVRSRILGREHGTLDVTRLRDPLQFRGSDEIEQFNQKYGSSEELSANDFLGGKSMLASDLCMGMPGLSLFLQQQGIAPNTMLNLDVDFALDFQAPGNHIVSHGYGVVDGEKVPMWAPNQSAIMLQ